MCQPGGTRYLNRSISSYFLSAAVSPKVIPDNGSLAVEIPVEVPAHTAAPDQVVPEEVVDVQTSMPMPPTPQGPELEPEKELKPAELKSSVPENEATSSWDMPETGKVINGRYYTKHALERMAPPTKDVIEELERRAIAKGYLRGCDKFKDYVQPRNIPPMVIEDAIINGTSKLGNRPDIIEHTTNCVKVFVNRVGNVVSVYPQ